MSRAFCYADGRTMRPGVRGDGTYLPTVHGRVAKALDCQPADVRHAVELFSDWTGRRADQTDARRLAHLVGCGFPPSAAAARELGYRLTRAFHFPRGRGVCPIGL